MPTSAVLKRIPDGQWYVKLARDRSDDDSPLTIDTAEAGEARIDDGALLHLTMIGASRRIWSRKDGAGVHFYDLETDGRELVVLEVDAENP